MKQTFEFVIAPDSYVCAPRFLKSVNNKIYCNRGVIG